MPDLVHRLVGASRDLGTAENVRLLLGEAAAEVDRLETASSVLYPCCGSRPKPRQQRQPKEDCDVNPYGLTPAESDIMDAMCREGVIKLAAHSLGLKLPMANKRLASARDRMGDVSTIRACVLWDRFRRPSGSVS